MVCSFIGATTGTAISPIFSRCLRTTSGRRSGRSGRSWRPQAFHSFARPARRSKNAIGACSFAATKALIERGIARFEGGAQGTHKLARGLLPVTTHSLHAIGDRGFAAAIADYCARERIDVAHAVDELEESSPFRDATK